MAAGRLLSMNCCCRSAQVACSVVLVLLLYACCHFTQSLYIYCKIQHQSVPYPPSQCHIFSFMYSTSIPYESIFQFVFYLDGIIRMIVLYYQTYSMFIYKLTFVLVVFLCSQRKLLFFISYLRFLLLLQCCILLYYKLTFSLSPY